MQHKKPEYINMILDCIEEYKDAHGGTAPTGAEVAYALGIAPSTVSKYMTYMREHGIISYSGHRNVSIGEAGRDASEYCRVPILGAVSCGLPKLAEENIEEYVKLPVSLFCRGSYFILRAKGDSMLNAGIEDGDLVVVRQQSTADYDQIAVALVEDEATLKRFRPDGETVILHPENPDYDDIIVDNCVIQGVAVKVIKDL